MGYFKCHCSMDVKVVVATSGHGNLVFGDSEGNIHLVNRSFQVTTFRAYELNIILIEQLRHTALIVTIGEDEPGVNPLIKVWNLEKQDKHGNPTCVRISRAIPNNKPTPATALCVHDNLNLMAVGFHDGSIVLFRGDVCRERTNKQKVLKDGGVPVTGLAFRTTAKFLYLYVSTTSSVVLFNITVKDKEIKVHLDGLGCTKRCSVLAETVQDANFMIGRDDAVYCYTPDGRGPCYAVEGQKILLQWFRSYLVIVAKEDKNMSRSSSTITTSTTSEPAERDKHMVTVLDIQNKFLVFSAPIKEVRAVLVEWGTIYILGGDHRVFQLSEKDLQSKLTLLFKKNLYDVSIRIAKSQQYDAEGLVDMFRQYGDHLYTKGDHTAAVDQYIKTIGKLEPSYVIRKYLDSQHIDQLTTYLQALHKHGLATEDHTTLLLNCYTKQGKPEKLKEFIMTRDREVDFDVEIAIKVCRQASSEDALMLAKKHGLHDWYLKIQIEDKENYKEALDYISCLEFEEAEANMKRYGNVLIQNAPEESTEFLKKLCTEYRPSNKPLVDVSMLDGSTAPSVDRASPEDFIHLFLNNSERLVEFLEHLVKVQPRWSALVYNTLIEHYLHVWSSLEDAVSRGQCEQKIVRLLQNSEANYDKDQTLILCQVHNFRSGILYLYEESKLYQHIVQYHIRQRDYKAVVASCRRFGHQDPNLWVQALWSCAKNSDMPSDLLAEILTVIAVAEGPGIEWTKSLDGWVFEGGLHIFVLRGVLLEDLRKVSVSHGESYDGAQEPAGQGHYLRGQDLRQPIKGPHLEVGSQGRYLKGRKKALNFAGSRNLCLVSYSGLVWCRTRVWFGVSLTRSVITEKQRLLSPLLVVDALSHSGTATVGEVRNYLLSVLHSEHELTEQEQQLSLKYRQETDKIRDKIKDIQTSAIIFQGSRCSACNHQLELPSIHFLCQHSYHQHCFQSYAENENECPACLPENKKILDVIRSQEQSRDLHETFHSQLERADDGFSLVADYFGRGVFNKLTVVTNSTEISAPSRSVESSVLPSSSYGPGAEARLRQAEGKLNTNLPDYMRHSTVGPPSEGRMRLEENKRSEHQYSTSLEANIISAPRPLVTLPSPRSSPARGTPAPSKQVSNPGNPFGEDVDYDESKNPFAGDDAVNPFEDEDDDYDKNLNPFA
uniref:RING-type domain-containing protein n=1 Tax=Timema genevievae TaxID=629358 RepID=A0A7R9JRP5_TIMGE|nr:unnamed protein product [Timema genevievae]